jgi:hypothetical protein
MAEDSRGRSNGSNRSKAFLIGSSPLTRVQEILFRMQQHPDGVDTMKTCCGALAILSRDEANKLMIVRDGLRLILSTMQVHDKREDLLEAACDLLWR